MITAYLKKIYKISFLSKNEKRDGFIKIIFNDCSFCGNPRKPFWVKAYKCSKCGADKFRWHTSAWCGNMLNSDTHE